MIASCADLAGYDLNGQCGNRIIEPSFGEECDGPVAGSQRCAGPNEPHACRYVCDGDATCPPEWACGSDEKCRPADTALTAHRELDTFPDRGRLLTGHLDDDAALDLVRFSDRELRVRFGDATRPLEDSLVVAPIRNGLSGALADFDGDGRDDVILPQRDGFTVLRSHTNRALVPYATPQLFSVDNARIETLVVRGDGAQPFHDLIRIVARVSTLEMITGDDVQQTPAAIENRCTTDDRRRCDLLRFTVLGDLDGDGRDELSAIDETTRIALYTASCAQRSGARRCELQPFGELDVPTFANVYSGSSAIAADVDGNNTLDLIIHLNTSISQPDAIAYQDGAGNFCATPPSAGSCAEGDRNIARPSDLFVPFGDCGLRLPPYRAVDLDGDGDTDYVADAIYLNDDGVLTPSNCLVGAIETLHTVVVADLDGDDLPEIIAVTFQPELAVYVGTADRVYNRRTIAFPSTALHATRGDFDGDGLEDVAIVAQPTDGQSGTELWILHGARDLSTLAPRLAGETELQSFEVIAAQLYGDHGRSLWSEDRSGVDLISDLLLTAGPASRDGSLAGFSGRADRVLESLHPLQLPEGQESKLAVRGDFSGAASNELLLLLSERDRAETENPPLLTGAILLEELDGRWIDTFIPLADCQNPFVNAFVTDFSVARVKNAGGKDSLLIDGWRTASLTAQGIVCGSLESLAPIEFDPLLAAAPLSPEGTVALFRSADMREEMTLVTQFAGRPPEHSPLPEELRGLNNISLAAGAGLKSPRLIAVSAQRLDELALIDHRWVFLRTLADFKAVSDPNTGLVEPGISLLFAQLIAEDFNEDRLADVVLRAPRRRSPLAPREETLLLYLRESDALP